jgi:uracil phosphoribosyltransferase
MIKIFTDTNSIINKYIAELRDVTLQSDRMRFRKNLERFGEIAAYKISQTLSYADKVVETPFGEKVVHVPDADLVITGILRAGLPLHQGLLNFFDEAGSAFVSTYRNHKADGSFEINLEYVTAPNLDGKTLIIADPMVATGSTISETLTALLEFGRPSAVHVVTVIACTQGLSYIRRDHPEAKLWVGSVDDELTAKSYIVPGLGDAGDLCFGEKKLD